MPKNSENRSQPGEAAAEPTPASQAKGSRQSSRKAAANEATSEAVDQAASASPTSQPPSAAPDGGENGKPAPASLTGLRGADYVKALSSHPLATIEVPLLPNERRGDWERAKGVKIRVTTRQLSAQEGTSANPWLERTHALAALIIELQRPGATRFDQIDLRGSQTREAIERLSDYVNQARLRVQAQTGKKWTANQVYLIPLEDA